MLSRKSAILLLIVMSDQALLASDTIQIASVEALDRHQLVNDVPNIQCSSISLEMETTSFGNPVAFVDHSGFITQFGGEMEQIAKMEHIEEQGKHYVHMIYAYRSVARAIPMVVCNILFIFSLIVCVVRI